MPHPSPPSRRGGRPLSRWQVSLLPAGYSLALGTVMVALPLRAVALAAGPLLLGGLGTVLLGAATLSYGLLGRLSDQVGRLPVMALGALLASAAVLSVAAIPRWWWLPVAAGLMGVGGGAYWPALEAKVAESAPPSELTAWLSRFNLSWSAANATGAFVAGWLVAAHPTWAFHLAAGELLLLSALVVALHLRPAGPPPATGLPAELPHPLPDGVGRLLLPARLANFTMFFNVNCLRWLFPKMALSVGMAEGVIGLLVGLLTASQAVSFFALGRFRAWQGRPGYLVGAQLLALFGALLAWKSCTVAGFALAFCSIGLAGGLAYTASLFYSLQGHAQRGRGAGLHETIVGCGSLSGPLLGGLAARQYTLRAALGVGWVVLVAGLVLLLVLWRRLRRMPA